MPFIKFAAIIGGQFVGFVYLFALLAPKAFANEVAHIPAVFGWALFIGLPLSLFEYFYHRYLLHSAVLPFLGSMHRAHSTHHGLTYVKAPVQPNEPERLVEVRSEFSVEHEHQEESMMFPYWSLPIFMFVFAILIALPLKLMFPQAPLVLALMISVTAFYSAYEIWHAALHLPFEAFWEPLFKKRFFGPIARRCYSFHLNHHWRPSSNLAVVGFWGIALWDHVFRTHRRPERIPLPGAEVNYIDASLPQPRWPVALLDRWQTGLFKMSRKIERFLAKTFLGRSSS